MRQQLAEALLALTADQTQLETLNILYGWEGLVEIDDSFFDDFRQFLNDSGVSANDYID